MNMVASTLAANDNMNGRACGGTTGDLISRILVKISCTTYASSLGVIRLIFCSSDAMVVVIEEVVSLTDGAGKKVV